jgi:hypothetical protein
MFEYEVTSSGVALILMLSLPFFSQIKAEVNELYRQAELDIDGVFKYMLLSQYLGSPVESSSRGKN